ncbi:MAG: hypothetical protein AAB299_05445 [Thermodesulfobacteriota bacterium]
MTENDNLAAEEVVISEEALKKATEFIEEEEGKTHKFSGWLAAVLTAIAVIMSHRPPACLTLAASIAISRAVTSLVAMSASLN